MLTVAVFVLFASVVKGRGEAVTAAHAVGLVLAVLLVVFLVAALLFPERF